MESVQEFQDTSIPHSKMHDIGTQKTQIRRTAPEGPETHAQFTRRCAKQLAEQLGAYFSVVNIEKSAKEAVQMFIDSTGTTPKYGKSPRARAGRAVHAKC